MKTKNKYIASIMLEAAELLKNDSESLNESILMSKDERTAIKNNKTNMKKASTKQLYKAALNGNSDAIKAWTNTMKKLISEASSDYELYHIGQDLEFSQVNALKKNIPELQKSISPLIQIIKKKLNISRDMSIINAYEQLTNKSLKNKENKNRKKEATKSAIREAIDLLYDKSMKCNTMDEAAEYINKAERLESLIDE